MRRVVLVVVILFLFSITGFWIGGFDFRAKAITEIEEIPLEPLPVELVLNDIERSKCLGDCEVSQAKDGNEFLVLDLTVKNLSPSNHLFNPLHVKIRDVNGYSYRHSYFSTFLDNYFSVTTLESGNLASGRLAYELPLDSRGVVLEFDSYYGEPLQSIALADD